MIVEIIVIYPIQRRKYRPGIDNLLVLLIWRNSNSHADSFICDNTHEELQIIVAGAITKKMAGMDVPCSYKIGTLTLKRLSVDKNLIEVFAKIVDLDTVVLMAARASRVENQDAIDAAIVGILADPKYVQDNKNIFNITFIELVFLFFMFFFVHYTCFDENIGTSWYSRSAFPSVSKVAPEQMLNLVPNKSVIECSVSTREFGCTLGSLLVSRLYLTLLHFFCQTLNFFIFYFALTLY